MHMQLEVPSMSLATGLIGLGLVVLAVSVAGLAYQGRYDWVFAMNVGLFVYFLFVLLLSPSS